MCTCILFQGRITIHIQVTGYNISETLWGKYRCHGVLYLEYITTASFSFAFLQCYLAVSPT